MVVKVYGSIRAACPQRVLACLLEKGIEFELVHVDLDKGEQKHPEFLLLQVLKFINTPLYIYESCIHIKSVCVNFLFFLQGISVNFDYTNIFILMV